MGPDLPNLADRQSGSTILSQGDLFTDTGGDNLSGDLETTERDKDSVDVNNAENSYSEDLTEQDRESCIGDHTSPMSGSPTDIMNDPEANPPSDSVLGSECPLMEQHVPDVQDNDDQTTHHSAQKPPC